MRVASEEIATEGQGAPTRGNRGRGTDSSNRVPSTGESANPRSLARDPGPLPIWRGTGSSNPAPYSREAANSRSLTKAHADRSSARPPASRQGGGTERCYGAGGEEMAPSSLREPMECPDAPAERLEQVPRRPGSR